MVVKSAELTFDRPDSGTLRIHFGGTWTRDCDLPSVGEVRKQIESSPRVRLLTFDTTQLDGWDSLFLTFIISVMDLCSVAAIPLDREGLPRGARRLLQLASAVPEWKKESEKATQISFLDRLGEATIRFWRDSVEMTAFVGDITIAFARLLAGRARFRRSDLILTIEECGVRALPIVSLISFLVGMILAFIGAIQLKIFGAQIYVASLVGIGMVRALAAIMTGIIMAGRTGASFAAQIGTMQVNEEIDALRTLGISPVEYLVLPRVLALSLMMPLLSLYADGMGILGGLFIGVTVLDLNTLEYLNMTQRAVNLRDIWVGLFTASVFGVLVSLAGCMRGIQCGRSASAVGKATTSAVVTSIVSIVVATAVITVLCNILSI